MTTDIRKFFAKYDIEIKNLDIFQEAFTHTSYANECNLNKSYENLEFLGDAVLQLKSAVFLYEKIGKDKNNQGELTKKRKSLVCEETLYKISKDIGLGFLVRLGNGEESTGGRDKPRILSDVFEAATAAIFIDSGDKVAEMWLRKTLLNDEILQEAQNEIIDYKTKFQEYMQSDKKEEIIYYEIDKTINSDNSTTFKMGVKVDGQIYGVGIGTTKKSASQMAAKDALKKFKNI